MHTSAPRRGRIDALLSVSGLMVELGGQTILGGVDLEVPAGEVVALIGRNGSGKSTTLRAIMGLLPVKAGSITFQGLSVDGMDTKDRSRQGIAYVPQSWATFPELSVDENLRLGARTVRDQSGVPGRAEEVYDLFPDLRDSRSRKARLLSGGQQRMLGVALALMRDSRLLLLDEPSAGLSPALADKLLTQVLSAIGPHRSVLLVEQNLETSLRHARHVVVIRDGVASEPMEPAQVMLSLEDIL